MAENTNQGETFITELAPRIYRYSYP